MFLLRLILVTVSISIALTSATDSFAQDAPVKIIQPAAGAKLSGKTEICVELTGVKFESMYVGFGGVPWTKLEQVDDSARWTATADTTMVPNGEHSLIVVTTNKKIGARVNVSIDNPLDIFWADLHSHTSYSDGTSLPVEAHRYARSVSGLDVFSLSDHLESVDDAEWCDTREVAWKANEDGRFVAIPGLEWTKRVGHINLIDPKTRHWPNDLAGFYAAIAKADVIAKFNHPGDGTRSHEGLKYSAEGDRAIQLMEVRSPEEEKAYIRALNAGWHIAAEGSDDTHSANWGNVSTWTGILAPGLSKRNILDALKNRRCYSSRDRNCRLKFSINGHPMGTIVKEPIKEVKCEISLVDWDKGEGDRFAKIEYFRDGEIFLTNDLSGAPLGMLDHNGWHLDQKVKPGKHYYFVKVTQRDGNMLWSAPIWVTVVADDKE